MALSIDSRAVLRAIAENPEAFPAVQADLDEFARKMLTKQIKARTTDAGTFAIVYGLIGSTDMSTILDSYAANDLAALVKKIDPYSPHAKAGGDPKQVRAHIADVAAARTPLTAKPEKPAKIAAPKPAKKPPPSKIGGILESKVHSGAARASRRKA